MALDPEGPGTRDVPGPSTSNSVSGTVHGPVAQIGVVHGDVNLVTGAPVRTRYLETVRRIAPRELIGREAELADLTDFCTSSTTPYRWWRAPAWSGKSALTATFVLKPPPGVRVVSFFITARLAAQNDRNAFIDNVLEQLVTLLDQPLPPLLTESTRESHLLSLLAEAAETCRSRGEHFVLLVDGLDEDRGVTTGPDTHSIAALLPAEPPAGMRVVVAGRPNPPIPSDVPDHHPLRDPEVVRPLAPSPAAQAERDGMERELKRLLRGTPTEQDLLGLLTAAGGGLTPADLAELTDWSAWDVEDHLRTVTGRSFSRRTGHHPVSDAYVLGHHELHVTAIDVLGPARLTTYRTRLHDWADTYRRRRWPAETPEYLLRDYSALLELTDDVPRMLACATDPDRHDLMLERSGGDGGALAEVFTAQSRLVSEEAPDLVALSRLAVHRDRLVGRNASLPRNLPGLWASLGKVSRAVALAESFTGTVKKDSAFLAVIRAVVRLRDGRSRHITRVVELADSIEDVVMRNRALTALSSLGRGHEGVESLLTRQCDEVQLIEDASNRDGQLATVVRAAARLGHLRQAEALLGSITDDAIRARAEGSVVRAVVASGDLGSALALAERVTDPVGRVQAIAHVAIAFGESGDVGRAADLLTRLTGSGLDLASDPDAAAAVRELAVLVDDQDHRPASLLVEEERESTGPLPRVPRSSALVEVAMVAGEFQRALGVVGSITDAAERESAIVQLIRESVREGRLALAESLVDAVSNPWRRRDGLAILVPALIAAGEHHRAHAALHRAEVAARGDGDTARQDRTLISLIRSVIPTGDLRQAEALARSIADPEPRATALIEVSRAYRRHSDPRDARRLLTEARVAAESIEPVDRRERALVAIVRTTASRHDPAEAAILANSLTVPRHRDSALRWLTRAGRAPGRVTGGSATPVPSSPGQAEDQDGRSAGVRDALNRGDLDAAEDLVLSSGKWPGRGDAIEAVIAASVRTGDFDRAQKMATSPVAAVGPRLSIRPAARDHTLTIVVECLVGLGEYDRAYEVAAGITHPRRRNDALWRLVEEALRAGEHDRASAVADAIPDPYPSLTASRLIPELTPEVASRVLARGLVGSDWHRCVGALSRLSPASLEAVIREVAVIDGRTRRVVQRAPRWERTPD